MKYVVQCPCGVSMTADGPESVIDQARAHAAEAHSVTLSRDQAREMMSIVGSPAARSPRRRRAQSE
ncbi:MAG: hypothetical protein ACRDHF_04140 [Tepidiformaceae bacterium]